MKTLVCVLLFSGALVAEDASFTGRWSGTATLTRPDGETRETPALLILKQDGNLVTGSAGPGEQQSQPIQNGKAERSKLTFEIQTAGEPVVFTLTLENGHLKGYGSGSPNGQQLKLKLDLTKGS
jgi:hypothetical protein